MKNEYPIVPGRGLVSATAKQLRLDYMSTKGHTLTQIPNGGLFSEEIKNNIESDIGSVEIPVGLVGPLLLNTVDGNEFVHTTVGTLEGALVASMNRGAKCISLAGGYHAHVIHQKMIRTPMFLYKNVKEGIIFKNWVESNFLTIKKIAESYSNHAVLEAIIPFVVGKSVHLKFVFTTGDASGQNMTTACTWHAVLWIQDQFVADSTIEIVHCIIEGNGASDKKVSHFSMSHGRGIHVVADVYLKEEVIQKVLRTSSDDFVRCFNQSVAMSHLDGMVGYNINVANAIAGIFSATGQDLGCIHESSCGVLNVEKTEDGLYVSLNLPSLVIGTIGGGTHLKKQREALEMMGCYGNGKVNRFAKLIVGFALSLELSTYAAIVSGQFAKAHEKLGRNKPHNWLLNSEITTEFVKNIIGDTEIIAVQPSPEIAIDNGILTNLTKRVTKKLIGFIPLTLRYKEEDKQVLLKSKPTDKEVVKGLHFMASSIDTELADLMFQYGVDSEYQHCHLKELEVYRKINDLELNCAPKLYGTLVDTEREIFICIQEVLDPKKLRFINSENTPELWDEVLIKATITTISTFHQAMIVFKEETQRFKEFDPIHSQKLYLKMIDLMYLECETEEMRQLTGQLKSFLQDLKTPPLLDKTIIHNDFNPRNIAIRANGAPCIYDWELAVINFPHRDIVEFLSFVLPEDVSESLVTTYLRFHFEQDNTPQMSWETWKEGYVYALKEFLITRVSFYQVGSILMKYEFAPRIFKTAFKMLTLLNTK